MEQTRQTIVSTDRERSIYNGLKKNASYNGMLISPSTIRVEVKIVNGKNVYSFQVTKDANSDSLTELKLDRNDKFLITHVGLMLMKRLATAVGKEVLQSYPNAIVFADNSSTFVGSDLEIFYNGSLDVKVGQTTFIEKMDSRRFREVTDSIQSATITQSSMTANTGFIELTPQILLDGDQKNDVQLTVPFSSGLLVANTVTNTDNYVVLLARGFRITKK